MRFAKITDGSVVQYPISGTDVVRQNSDTSFPQGELSVEMMQSYGCEPVVETMAPIFDPITEDLNDTVAFMKCQWTQTWTITEASPEEMAQRQASRTALLDAQRAEAYRNESDPLFFMAQRGEAMMQDWLDKVAEIKARYPSA